jgi:CheY-like chemotaxis protein
MQQILVIEDDSALQRVLKRLVQAEGYAVDPYEPLRVDGRCLCSVLDLTGFRACN